jgi:hypothetical protein
VVGSSPNKNPFFVIYFWVFSGIFCTGDSLSELPVEGSQATACGIGPFLLASSADGAGKHQ